MAVLMATGHVDFDNHLKQSIDWDSRIEHLEEVEYAVYSTSPKIIILSEFIPSITDENQILRKYKSMLNVLEVCRNNGVRVIFLSSMNTPTWVLGKCVSLGIYDLVLTDGNIQDKVVIDFFNNPATEQQARDLLSSIDDKKKTQHQIKPRKHRQSIEYVQEKVEELDNNQPNEEYEEHPDSSISIESEKKKEFSPKHINHLEMDDSNEKHTENDEQIQMQEEKLSETHSKAGRRTHHEVKDDTQETNKPIDIRKSFAKDGLMTVAFWSVANGMGSRTLSETFAKMSAERGAKVLYVELDYFNPQFAMTTGLSHSEKNFYRYTLDVIEQGNVDVEPYIAQPEDVNISKKVIRKTINSIPNNLHFLTFPKEFRTANFPVIENGELITNLFKNLEYLQYDLIVFNLPKEIKHMFTFPVMLLVDEVFNVMTCHPARMNKYMQLRTELESTPLEWSKVKTIFNKVNQNISKEAAESFINESSLFMVPFDEERATNELDITIGSELINLHIGDYLERIGLESIEPKEKRRKVFGFSL